MSQGMGFELWLEFENWMPEPGDDPEDDFFNMIVTLASGKRYALNVWTFKLLERVVRARRFGDLQEFSNVGEAKHPLEREYLTTPDLVVSRLDGGLMRRIVAHLLDEWGGELSEQWECDPPLTEEELNEG